ncbi:MAG TPA: DUF445 domain-containing protein, partial [Burkholderiales bacterium]|nr:DUF445 domain-containing protein [Betaproteobacteria bacterium]HQR53864.1 DUF445 domain-containing protein [Burkholderiales bacterium]
MESPRTAAATERLRPRRRLHGIATGLLVAMLLVYGVATLYAPSYPWLGVVRAFAEAAAVGALADWFAVVAMFRHPLGLPIPHTAIIPRNKDRIGASLGRFVEQNFLEPELLHNKLADVDLARHAAQWLKQEGRSSAVATRVTDLLPQLLDAVEDEDVSRFISEQLLARVDEIEAAPLAGRLLGMLTQHDRHQEIMDALLKSASRLLGEYDGMIRQKITENTAWLLRKFRLDAVVAKTLLTAAEQQLREVSEDPAHPWRLRFDAAVREFIAKLTTSPEYLAQGERLKAELLEHPAVRNYVAGLWGEIKGAVRRDAAQPGSKLKERVAAVIVGFADALLVDEALRLKVDGWVKTTVVRAVTTRRREVGLLIAETMRRWDARTFTDKIEQEVGNDLQYIRLNGTIIGGLA